MCFHVDYQDILEGLWLKPKKMSVKCSLVSPIYVASVHVFELKKTTTMQISLSGVVIFAN